jgi:hypothetical protein
MQKTQKPQPVRPAPKFVPPNHLNDDFGWEFFKILAVAGIPTLIFFYAFEVFIPFGEMVERYERLCTEKGGVVFNVSNQERTCIKKDAFIKIEE